MNKSLKSSSKSQNIKLSTSLSELPLIGPNTFAKFVKLGLLTVRDLLHHIPFRYKDTSQSITIKQLLEEGEGMIVGTCETISSVRVKRFLITKARVSDETGKLNITWFNQPYITNTFKSGEKYLIEGKITAKKGFTSIVAPQFERFEEDTEETHLQGIHLGRVTPYYEATEGLSSKFIRARVFQLRSQIASLVKDPLSSEIIKKENLVSLEEALVKVHFPENFDDIAVARNRLGFDELLSISIDLEKEKLSLQKHSSVSLDLPDKYKEKFLATLPYSLTVDQESSIKQILEDISKPSPMRILLNGDVGSGKTIVAVLACYTAICNGYSALVMAPTTILAQQHFVSFKKLLEPLGIQVLLRISGDKLNLDAFKNGTPAVIVGTHALLHEKNLPDNIALVVVDEQHRFGVAQREKLLQLDNLLSDTNVSRIPHYLSMTATPIPRTLTNVLYGDMEVSFIKSMPKDRLPIKSYFVPDNKRDSCFKWVKQHIVDSKFVEQAFVVFPLIDESDKVEAKAAKTEFEVLQNGVFKGLKVGLIHGQLKQDEKDTVLEQFRNKEFNVLVATSVIEVGIDIPDATIMIIEDAERFGLAQLHQFRGRVGRGSLQSYCYVLAGEGQKSNVKSQADIETDVTSQIHREGESLENEAAIERLKYFCSHPSGFDVAEYDLQSRGPGEVYGKIQSGIPNLKIANILDLEGVEKARKVARTLLQSVPESEIESIKNQLFHVRASTI